MRSVEASDQAPVYGAPLSQNGHALVKAGPPNLHITTLNMVYGGMPGTVSPRARISMTFAIAPMGGSRPRFDAAVVLSSDENGHCQVNLPPGRYWIGPREKVVQGNNFVPGNPAIREMMVNIEAGRTVRVDLVRAGFAP